MTSAFQVRRKSTRDLDPSIGTGTSRCALKPCAAKTAVTSSSKCWLRLMTGSHASCSDNSCSSSPKVLQRRGASKSLLVLKSPRRQPDEAGDEEGGEDEEQPVVLADLAAQQLDQRVGGDAEGEAVGDREGQRDQRDGEEGGDRDFGIVPLDVDERCYNQPADQDQRGGGRGKGHELGIGRDEHREEEEDAGDHRG